MKIVIIINNLGFGGAERLVVYDINEMIKRGIDVYLITLKNKEKNLINQCNLSKEKHIKNDFGSLLNIFSWIKIIKQIKNIKPDIVFTHLWYSNVIGVISSKFANVKKIITFEHNVYDNLKTQKMFMVDRFLQYFVNNIVAVSYAVKESLIKHKILSSKIKVIQNCIDLDKYKKDERTDIEIYNMKKEFKIEKTFNFIFIGRLIKQKGLDILIKSLKKLSFTDYKLLIVGEGDELQNLMSLVEELNLYDKVLFLGVRSNINTLLHLSDCFILPSRYEGLPMVLLEAMATNKPSIVSDFDSAKELIVDMSTGLIVPKEDIDALAGSLNRIYKDSLLREKIIHNLKNSKTDISIVQHVDRLLDFLK